MYTQCPECQIAFRVTAKVLQQAAGNVRCGSCGHAFNALHYLSEDMPDPTGAGGDEPVTDELAETSKRLLETLDELAGPDDVRIEDTGVEWRVLDEDSPPAPQDERRYDDNSPLPDEYDDVEYSPPVPQRRESDVEAQTEEFEERQQDLALSEPEDWTDILEEVSVSDVDSFAVEEELVAIHNELTSVEGAPSISDDADDIELEVDEPVTAELSVADEAMTDEVPQLDESEFESDEPVDDEESLIEEIEAVAVEIDEDLGADLRGAQFEEDTGDEPEDDDGLEFADVDEDDESGDLDEESTDDAFPQDLDETLAEGLEASADELHDDVEDVLAASSIGSLDDDEDQVDLDASLELALDADEDAETDLDTEDDAEEVALTAEEVEEPDIPEPTEEEMTVNMEIDEQMMALAQEDDEFSKTLVGVENPEELFNENSEEVETIIMEGEFIRSEVEKERLAAENAARSQLDDPARLADTYALSREKYRRRSYDPPAMGLLAAIAALTLLLAGQYIHNSRDSLATYGFFQQTVAPIYRVFGSPVTPAWDIKGWQFEATSGSVDEEETQLTIVSRIVNRSEQPLPFPLVHVSLTNRFEDVMGSRVLDPADYLPDGRDPSELVSPGVNFNAVIVIEQPSPEATGFKLNVCYRVEAGVVRCALEDFK